MWRSVALLVTVLGGLQPAPAQASERVYCCEDSAGRRICGDTLPPACYNRAYKEMSRSGIVYREVEAPLTPEQRVVRERADKERKAAEARVAERRRRDKALLESYRSVTEIETRRDTTLRAAQQEIDNLRLRETALLKERKDLDTRLSRLKGRPAAATVQEDIAANSAELAALRRVIGQKQREFDTLAARFEEDRGRYLELSSALGQSTPASTP